MSGFWAANPSMSYLTGLSLLDETKRQMEKLWTMLDIDGDGALTAADWGAAPGGGGKWDLLRADDRHSGPLHGSTSSARSAKATP